MQYESADRLLTEKQAAEILQVAPATLRRNRCTGGVLGTLPFVKIGTSVRYSARDLTAFIDSHRVAEIGGAA